MQSRKKNSKIVRAAYIQLDTKCRLIRQQPAEHFSLLIFIFLFQEALNNELAKVYYEEFLQKNNAVDYYDDDYFYDDELEPDYYYYYYYDYE